MRRLPARESDRGPLLPPVRGTLQRALCELRIADLADGGEILTSSLTNELVTSAGDLRFRNPSRLSARLAVDRRQDPQKIAAVRDHKSGALLAA